MTAEQAAELKFLKDFRELPDHVFTVKNGRFEVLDQTYYVYHESKKYFLFESNREPLVTDDAAEPIKALDGERFIISIPDINSKIYELQHLDRFKQPLFDKEYTKIMICRTILTDDDEKRKLFYEKKYFLTEWYREDYHFVHNVKLV